MTTRLHSLAVAELPETGGGPGPGARRQFRVIGPPGTGKTSYLARQLRNAAASYGASKVTVVSLTNASAARVVEKAAEENLGVPDSNMTTLHALAYRAVGAGGIAEKNLAKWNEYALAHDAAHLRVGADGDPDRPAPADGADDAPAGDDVVKARGHSPGDAAFADLMIRRAKMQPPEQWPAETRQLADLWQRFKDELRLFDFTDLLEVALRDSDACPGDPAALFVDEAQDFSRLAWALVRKWGENCVRFVTVGDPDQLLFGWAGSDVEAFYDPPLPDGQTRVLHQSYRVPRAVHAAAVDWIGRTPGRPPVQYQPTKVEGAVAAADCLLRMPEGILPLLDEHLGHGRTVAVVASNNYALRPVMAALRRRGYPFHNPYAPERGDFNPLRSAGGVTAADRLAALLKVGRGADGAMWTVEDLRRWTEWLDARRAMTRGGKALVKDWAERHGPDKPLVDAVDDLINYDDFLAVMPRESWLRAIAGDLDWYAANVAEAQRRKLAYPMAVLERGGAGALTAQPGVILSTIHSCKGGEADVVLLFPDLSPAASREWDRPPGTAGREEIRRAFYVGMTRARHTLYLCGASSPLAVSWN